MKKINLIFDFDGTLFDSYPAIVDWVKRALSHFGVCVDENEIREMCLYHNVSYALNELSLKYDVNHDKLLKYIDSIDENINLIKPYVGLEEIVKNEQFNCFIYTHRGISSMEILSNYNLKDNFIEVVNGTYGFNRKPDPQGIDYLVDKYHLNKNETYYVGDRIIDIQCGINAGVKTIFINSAKLDIDYSFANYVIDDLKSLNKLNLY